MDLSPSDISDADVEADWQRWRDLLLGAAADHIPSKKVKRRNTPPRIDGEVKHLLKKKNTARRKAIAKSSATAWETFRELRRQSKYLIPSKREEFFQSLPDLLRTSTKKFWSSFKSGFKQSTVPNKMTWTRSDSTITATNPGDIANLLNEYFYSVFKPSCCTSSHCVVNLQPPTCCDSNDNILRTLSDISLSPTEVRDVLLSLDPNKATVPDKIPAKLLKVCAPHIYFSLCALFNKCLHLEKMPSSWKQSNIVPIIKGGTAEEVSNYRPISLLPLFSKVLERCVYNRVIDHIAPQLHKLQFGFLKGKSTTAQLLQVLHNIDEKLDKRVQVDAIYLEFAKIHRFGICGTLLSWFEDYFTDRVQRVTVLGVNSKSLPVLSGVPQGSILGPLLFLIYVNDLPNVATSTSVARLFADDTKCYRPIKCIEDGACLQLDLDHINHWCDLWQMDLNQSNCGLLSITRNASPFHFPYQ